MEYEDLPKYFPEIYTEQQPQINGTYHPNQYKALFENLNLLKETPKADILPQNVMPPASNKIPDILHYIWLGGELPKKYFENIAFFAEEMKKIGGVALIWTDQFTVSDKLKKWLKENEVLIISVSTFFSNTAMLTYYPFKTALTAIPPNYGEASDLLRYEILALFGGYYLDCDVKKSYFDFPALRSLGAAPVFGFVCGYSNYPRNDIFGSLPQSALCKNLKKIVLQNYKQKIWNEESHMRNRPLMNHATVRTTGPNAFEEAVNWTLQKVRRSKNVPANTSCCIQVNSNHSDESWIVYRVTAKKKNQEDSVTHIKHDLCLSTFYDDQVLDLQKYNPSKSESFIEIIHDLLQNYPSRFQHIDRIFISDIEQYGEIQAAFEASFSKPILWNELASLKFACLMGLKALAQYFIRKRSVDPFAKNSCSYINMGHYECHFASPLLLAIERGHPEIVQLLIETAKTPLDVHKCLKTPGRSLIYSGEKNFGLNQNCFWFPTEHIRRLKAKKDKKPDTATQVDQKIEQYEMVSALIEPFHKSPD